MGLKAATITDGIQIGLEQSNIVTLSPLEAKDRRISRQGLYQAALQSMAAVQFSKEPTLESYLETVEKIANTGLEFVNRA